MSVLAERRSIWRRLREAGRRAVERIRAIIEPLLAEARRRLEEIAREVRERVRPPPPPPPKPPVAIEEKTVEFKVNLFFYSFRATYTTKRVMPVSQKPEEWFSEVEKEAEAYFWTLPKLWFTPTRKPLLRMEIGYEEI